MQKEQKEENFPPVVAVAALFIDRGMRGSSNITGILYEIPAVTSLVSLRSISKKEVRRVGVLYREGMEDMIEINQQFCNAEGIELIAQSISKKDARAPPAA